MRDEAAIKKNISLRAEQLNKALITLESMTNQPMRADRSNVDASIKRFEYTFEMFWKFLKALLEAQGVEKHYPKDVLIQAYSGHMINDEGIWIDMLKDRNNTSHTYREELADEIYIRIKQYAPIFRQTLEVLKKKYAL